MKIIKTNGLVLKKNDFGEADRYLTILTADFGKIRLLVKGIRKTKKRDLYSTDIGVLSRFVAYEKEELGIVSSAELIEPFSKLKNDIEKIYILMYVLKLTDFFIVENEPDEKSFEKILKFLKYLDNNNDKFTNMLALLCLVYYFIEMSGIPIEFGEGRFLDMENGVITGTFGGNMIKLSENEKKIFTFLNSIDIKAIYKLKLTLGDLTGAISILEEYIKFHLDLKFKLNDFIKEDF